MENKQLAFPFEAHPAFDAASYFISPCNHEAHASVMRWPNWMSHGFILSGPEGSGKSHLAHVWAQKSAAVFFPVSMLDEGFDAGMIGNARTLVVDNADGAPSPVALFHLLNWVKEQGGSLLLTARTAAKHWPFTLPDLRSRLAALPAASLNLPDDVLLTALLTKLFADRQVAVSASVIAYLATHMERSYPEAGRIVARLDAHALATSRSITLPMVKECLGI